MNAARSLKKPAKNREKIAAQKKKPTKVKYSNLGQEVKQDGSECSKEQKCSLTLSKCKKKKKKVQQKTRREKGKFWKRRILEQLVRERKKKTKKKRPIENGNPTKNGPIFDYRNQPEFSPACPSQQAQKQSRAPKVAVCAESPSQTARVANNQTKRRNCDRASLMCKSTQLHLNTGPTKLN